MERRKFIQLSLVAATAGGVFPSCTDQKKIKGKIVGASASVGHLLRDHTFSTPTSVENKKLVIVGGGVSGLTAAYFLTKNGFNDFLVLDLEKSMGGNAASGKNEVSSFPWGAHYVPTPNNDLTEYLTFLQECDVITGFDDKGLPIYNEYFLCFDPQDRLYINGRWQEGIVPHYGVPDEDATQIKNFLAQMDVYRYKKGSDGKEAFAIPVDNSSKDKEFTDLDKLTMREWLTANEYTSDYLHWYINYCTRDDFGTPSDKISAWAGIHYFASRKGKGGNAEHHDVLTWPEGNSFFIRHLEKNLEGKLRNDSLVIRINKDADAIQVDYFDNERKELKQINAAQCIIAVPQFIAGRLLNDENRTSVIKKYFNYMPWMVANLKVKNLEERSGATLSWDNVFYDSESLGYVEATHELIQQNVPHKNITYYLPLTTNNVTDERRSAQQKTHEEWVEIIFDDLKMAHPNIETATEEVNVLVWGHAMVQPLPGMIHGEMRSKLSESLHNNIHFAHTDLAGISIFEEGFYQGLNAAKKVLKSI